jgi:hypothetical protein
MDSKVTGLMVPIFGGTSNIRRSSAVKVTDSNLPFQYSGRSSVTGQFDLKGP